MDMHVAGTLFTGAATDNGTLSLAQVERLSSVSESDLRGLVDYGVLTPVTAQHEPWLFDKACVATLQRAGRLRADLDLDGHAFALAVMFLNQVTGLEAELRNARCALQTSGADPRHPGGLDA